jgi:glutamine synthetase
VIINAIVADVLGEFADILEKSKDFKKELSKLIKTTIKKHRRIIFNGNNYSAEWKKDAEKRGLLNLPTAADALPCLIKKKNIAMFKRQGVLSQSEINSRYEIMLENYCKIIHIEALTLLDLMKKELIPAAVAYQNDLAKLIKNKKLCGGFTSALEDRQLGKLSGISVILLDWMEALESDILNIKGSTPLEIAKYYQGTVIANMTQLRETADEIENMLGRIYFNLPLYGEILYSVN